MITESQRIENEHYLQVINNLQPLLEKHVMPQNMETQNRVGLDFSDELIIRKLIMDCVKKIKV